MSRCATIVEPSPYPDATSRRDKMLERAMYDPSPSATMQWRRKSGPKIPAADAVRDALRAEAGALDFCTLYKQPLGRYYFLMYVRDVAPAQGDFLLGVGHYRSSRLERREIARGLLDGYAAAVSEIFSMESPDASAADASRRGVATDHDLESVSEAQLLIRYINPGVSAAEVREVFSAYGPLTFVRVQLWTGAGVPKTEYGSEYNAAVVGYKHGVDAACARMYTDVPRTSTARTACARAHKWRHMGGMSRKTPWKTHPCAALHNSSAQLGVYSVAEQILCCKVTSRL